MTWQSLLIGLYTLACLIFLDNTYREGVIAADRWNHARVAGLLACLVWPAVLLVAILSVLRNRQTG